MGNLKNMGNSKIRKWVMLDTFQAFPSFIVFILSSFFSSFCLFFPHLFSFYIFFNSSFFLTIFLLSFSFYHFPSIIFFLFLPYIPFIIFFNLSLFPLLYFSYYPLAYIFFLLLFFLLLFTSSIYPTLPGQYRLKSSSLTCLASKKGDGGENTIFGFF